MKTLLLAEITHSEVSLATRCAITAAQQLQQPVDLLIVDKHADTLAKTAAHLSGVQQILINSDPAYADGSAESICLLLTSIAESYSAIMAASSCYSRNILPRLAALLNVAHLANITQIIDKDTFVRPIYAGNVLATVKTSDTTLIGTIRHTAFAHSDMCEQSAAITDIDSVHHDDRSHVLSEQLSQSERPSLADARIIVSGGRGFKNQQDLEKLLFPLADKLNAAIGATRAIVDAGFISNEHQVGQTGQIVAPELYIAIGVSGQIQHIAGMKDSKIIVAINQDPEAPIMKIADYALVADLYEAIPALLACLG